MLVITAPQSITNAVSPKVFLAGSIDQDTATNWQNAIITFLCGNTGTILNPRRAPWDPSWEQKIENPDFYAQVTWELNSLDNSDIIVMYFDANSKSPISLLELGLYASSGKLIVYCPDGYWRKGNVDIVCEKYNIPEFSDLGAFLDALKLKVEHFSV